MRDIVILTVTVFVLVVYDAVILMEVAWHLIAVWLALAALLYLPKQFLAYARDINDHQVALKESIFSKTTIVDRNDISTIDLYEVDQKPIGLKIVCRDDSIVTFVPLRFDVALLERIRLFILQGKT